MKAIYRQALRHIQEDDWDAAHRLIQDYTDPFSCQIHAYLHRIEGDLANARYWYHRAGLAMPDCPLDEALNQLLRQLSKL